MTAKKPTATQRRASATKKSDKKPQNVEVKANPDPPAPQQRAVIVELTPANKFVVRPVNIDAYSLPTILALAAKEVNESFGL